MKKVSIKAICAGVVIGLVGSTLASIVIAIVYGIPLDKIESGYSNSLYLISDLFLSLVVVFLSGYATGKIGKDNPVINSIIVGAIQLIILSSLHLKNPTMPGWYTVTMLMLLLPAAYLGGKVASKKTDLTKLV